MPSSSAWRGAWRGAVQRVLTHNDVEAQHGDLQAAEDLQAELELETAAFLRWAHSLGRSQRYATYHCNAAPTRTRARAYALTRVTD